MEVSPAIHFLPNHQINKPQWDDCITKATNSLLYGYSFYLDHLCPQWHALIHPGYDWVLPLTQKNKYGIKYLYQPPFMQQGGVFAKPGVDIPWQKIIQWIQQHYKFAEVQWHNKTPVQQFSSLAQVEAKTNFVLDLSLGHPEISYYYHKDLQRNIKRGLSFGFAYRPLYDHELCINMYRQYYGERFSHVMQKDYEAFTAICHHLAQSNSVVCRKVENENNEILATALLLTDGKRLYNMMNTTTPEGRKTEANPVLLDGIIKEFCGQPMLFDFEGSDLPGVKKFYENFSPENQPYYVIRYNHLPWPLKLLKQ